MSPSEVTRLAGIAGRGQRVLPRVYSVTTGPLSRRQEIVAALLYGGLDAQVASVTSLELRGFSYLPPDTRVHLLVPATRRTASRAFVALRRTSDVPAPHSVQGLPATPVARASVDACRTLASVRDAIALLAEAVQRRGCTVAMLGHELERGPRRGSAVCRRALAEIMQGAESAPEAEAVGLLARSLLLPAPRLNHPVSIDGRTMIADLCWPQARLIIEIDSVEHHGLGPAAQHTARRRSRLTAAGWTVLSISPWRLRNEAAAVIQEAESAFLQGIRAGG